MILKFTILNYPKFKKLMSLFFSLNGWACRQFFGRDQLQKYFLLSNGLWQEQFDLFYHGETTTGLFQILQSAKAWRKKYTSYVFLFLRVDPLKLKKEQNIWVSLSWCQISVISCIECTILKQVKMCFCMVLSILLGNC